MMIEIYRDARGEWRWRAVARNGRIIADGGEGYASRTGTRRAVNRLHALMGGMKVIYVESL